MIERYEFDGSLHAELPYDPEPQDRLAARLTEALERPRALTIAPDFAARMAAAAARMPVPTASAFRPRFAAQAGWCAMAALLVAMLALAPWAGTLVPMALTMELLLGVEFLAVAAWLSLRKPAL